MQIEMLMTDEYGIKVFYPAVEEGIEWTTTRRGSPGKLTFKVLWDEALDIAEGSGVRLSVDGNELFMGYVFSISRGKDSLLGITAYDQIRYLKNKDTYVYKNMTVSSFLQMVALDFSLETGELEDTGYVIASRVEEDTALLDMIESGLDLTLSGTGEMYVLYDDFGRLTLRNIAAMQLPVLIDEQTGENYQYTSSIDSDTYNKIKLVFENDKTGKRDVYTAKDEESMKKWGILQYYKALTENENGDVMAAALLKSYNQKLRKLQLDNALGDTRVRGGSMVGVQLDLGDVRQQSLMLVESVTHKFNENEHFMNLEVRGGGFSV